MGGKKISPHLLNTPGLAIQSSRIQNESLEFQIPYKVCHEPLSLSSPFFCPSYRLFPSQQYGSIAWDTFAQNQEAQTLLQSVKFFVAAFQVAAGVLSIFQIHINKNHFVRASIV